MNVGSLFAGIGGFDLGLERAGFEIAWQVEIDPYCQRVLAKHWPHVRRYGDIRAIDWASVEPVEVLCGGFPCQDISNAGKREGIEGKRSGLWKEFRRAICELRPSYIFMENVSALRSRGLSVVLADLAALGFDAEWNCIPASAVGAPHQRDRVWILAYPTGQGPQGHRAEYELGQGEGQMQIGRSDWWASEPGVQRVAHGIPNRVDRLRAIGNSIVPQIAEWLGRRILAQSPL